MYNDKIKTIMTIIDMINNHNDDVLYKTRFKGVSPYIMRIYTAMLQVKNVYFDTDGVTFIFNDGKEVFKDWDKF